MPLDHRTNLEGTERIRPWVYDTPSTSGESPAVGVYMWERPDSIQTIRLLYVDCTQKNRTKLTDISRGTCFFWWKASHRCQLRSLSQECGDHHVAIAIIFYILDLTLLSWLNSTGHCSWRWWPMWPWPLTPLPPNRLFSTRESKVRRGLHLQVANQKSNLFLRLKMTLTLMTYYSQVRVNQMWRGM